MNPLTILLFLAGFALLIVGARMLVQGASRLACTLGVPPLIIGLTIVALGTSSPEMAVAIQSSLSGGGEIAVGNIIGSNIVNVLFVIGVSALIVPLVVRQQLIRLDVPLMIVISILLFILSFDGNLGILDGVLLVSGLIFYTIFAIRQSRKESRDVEAEYEQEFGKEECKNIWQVTMQILLVGIGLYFLTLGSRWLVDGAKAFALALGLSDLIVGLTIVAVGTGMPEVVTSVTASMRGERDIAVGNVIGSNIYNILAVLGVAAILAPDGLQIPSSVLAFDLPVMIAVAVACLPIFFLDFRIARWEGALFLGYYIAYLLYLILEATNHDALSQFSLVMVVFVIPITILTLAIIVMRYFQKKIRKEQS